MKVASYKDHNERKRLLRLSATEGEFLGLNLGKSKFLAQTHPDGSIEVKRSQYEGSRWTIHTRRGNYQEYQLSLRVPSDHVSLFTATEIPSTGLGKPDDEILMLMNTKDLKLDPPKQIVTKTTKTNGAHKVHTEVTPINPKIMRRVHELLGDYFDEDKGKYRQGYSDDRIAREAECSIVFVQKQRTEAYGELTPDVDLRLRQVSFVIQTVFDEVRISMEKLHKARETLNAMFDEQEKRGK